MNGGREFLQILSEPVRKQLEKTEISFAGLQEVRIRVGRPVLLRVWGKEYSLDCLAGQRDIQETLSYAGNYSLYAYEEEFRQGFFTIRGGHRIGLSGRANLENGRIASIRPVSCLNIRLAHEQIGCGVWAEPYLWDGGRLKSLLILSPPGCGKTTLLRDLVRILSDERGVTVSVVDERSEIAACFQGVPQNQVGLRTDVLDGAPKAEGLFQVIRTMAPEAAAVDELGGGRDVEAVREAGRCGCAVLATAHGSSLDEIRKKPGLGELLGEQMFGRILVLGRAENGMPGVGKVIYDGTGRSLWRQENR